jgi:hypothetical protein
MVVATVSQFVSGARAAKEVRGNGSDNESEGGNTEARQYFL